MTKVVTDRCPHCERDVQVDAKWLQYRCPSCGEQVAKALCNYCGTHTSIPWMSPAYTCAGCRHEHTEVYWPTAAPSQRLGVLGGAELVLTFAKMVFLVLLLVFVFGPIAYCATKATFGL